MNEKQQTGQQGEELALKHLIQKDYTIVETNWRYGHLEVDIIAETADKIIFCEVKTRSSLALVSPESAVNLQKQRNLIKAANFYVTKKNIPKEVQFDIISIYVAKGKGETTIEHIEGAFLPRW